MINKTYQKLIDLILKHPGKFLLVVVVLGLVTMILFTMTINITYSNNKWNVDINKNKLELKKK